MANLATSPDPVLAPNYAVSHPRVPASPVTYTQTYSTADVTVSTATAVAVATTAATQTTPFGYAGAAQADAIPVAVNALIADVLQLRKLVNSLIDQQQAAGIAL